MLLEVYETSITGDILANYSRKWLEVDELLAVLHAWEPGRAAAIAVAALALFCSCRSRPPSS